MPYELIKVQKFFLCKYFSERHFHAPIVINSTLAVSKPGCIVETCHLLAVIKYLKNDINMTCYCSFPWGLLSIHVLSFRKVNLFLILYEHGYTKTEIMFLVALVERDLAIKVNNCGKTG